MTLPRYMLDTDIVIRLRHRHPDVMRRMAAAPPDSTIVSVVSYGELRVGVEKHPTPDVASAGLAALVAIVPVSPLPTSAGAAYGEIRAHLERRGESIGPNDLWIAAHARSLGLTLVTGNEREFRRVPGLAVENWADAA